MGEEKMIREETMRYSIEGERLSHEKTLKRVVVAFSLIIQGKLSERLSRSLNEIKLWRVKFVSNFRV